MRLSDLLGAEVADEHGRARSRIAGTADDLPAPQPSGD
jgi:hypothetical protein